MINRRADEVREGDFLPGLMNVVVEESVPNDNYRRFIRAVTVGGEEIEIIIPNDAYIDTFRPIRPTKPQTQED